MTQTMTYPRPSECEGKNAESTMETRNRNRNSAPVLKGGGKEGGLHEGEKKESRGARIFEEG